MPRIRFLFLVFLFALPARAEFPVTENRPLAPTLGDSRDARVVATDEGFLAFWRTTTTYGMEGLAQIARFSRDGELERRNTAWLLPASFQWYDGASNGDQVLLAGACTGLLNGPLCLARFSAAGDLLGYTGLPFQSAVAPSVTSNGDGFLVTFSLPFPREVLAVPVTREGVAGDAIRVGTWDPGTQWTSPAALDNAYYVAFGTTGGHALARIDGRNVAATVPVDAPVEVSQIRIASSADRLLVVITPRALDASNDPRPRSAVYDRNLQRVTSWTPLDGGSSLPRVEPTSSGWIVGTLAATGAALVPVSLGGSPGNPTIVEGIKGFGPIFDVAAHEDRAALVWITEITRIVPDFPHNAVRAAFFDGAATALAPPQTISLGPVAQIHPAAAHGNGVTLAAWVELDPAARFVVKTRPFDATGAPLAPPRAMPFRGEPQAQPRVGFDSASFFVIWSEGTAGTSGIYGARVGPDGELLDAESIPLFGAVPIGGYARTAAIDWSGSAWIVVSSDEQMRIVARRVAPNGTVLDTDPVAISPPDQFGADYSFAPALDCTGSECLVGWHGPALPYECRISGCPAEPPTIRAARITNDLRRLDEPHILGAAFDDSVRTLKVTWNEVAHVWLVSRFGGGTALIRRDGSRVDGVRSSLVGDIDAIPEGSGWRLLWTTYSFNDLFHGWSATGTVGEIVERWMLTRSAETERAPRLVDAPRPLATFMRESEINAGSPQVFARFLDEAGDSVPTSISLTAERIGGGKVRLAWWTDLGDAVRDFSIWRLIGGQWQLFMVNIAPYHRVLEFDFGAAQSFRVGANTSYGAVVSEIATLPAARHRTVGR